MGRPVPDMDKIVSLCKRRGFVFPGSEIYGGFGNTWDYGPLGSLLKNNVKAAWIKSVVQERDDMVLIDAAILMHPQVWQASGHLESFTDPLVDCKICRQRFRADQIPGNVCPTCGGELTEARQFNLMFKTFVGPVEEEAAVAYLRPETAQGIFVNFKNVLNTSRKRLPFGIAQVGKAFRNEITPGNFIFRTREFEQMEIEYFVKPGTDEEIHSRWVNERVTWYERYGLRRENLQLREHAKDELAHYAKAVVDLEYLFPFGWCELEGIANRTDFDLRQHQTYSGEDLTYLDDQTQERYLPYVIEPSAGADRATLAFLVDAYDEERENGEVRVVLRLHKDLAPIKVAFLPLSRKPDLVDLTKKAQKLVQPRLMTMYDDTQSIGRRYRRQDEIGTPYCVTIDFQSLEDHAATIRDRDTMSQVRVPIDELPHWFADAFGC